MPRYVVLINWTDQGIENFRGTVDRHESLQREFEQLGVRFVDVYWTLGDHDSVAVMEAPDDETATAALLSVCSRGSIRTKTLRAFTSDEMRGVIDKAP